MAVTYRELLNALKQIDSETPETLNKEFQLDVYNWDTGETSVYGIENFSVNNDEIKLEDTVY